MDDQIDITSKLQTASYEVFKTVTATLQIGLSETEIEQQIREELLKKDITEYWYDVPIFVLIGTQRFFDMAEKEYAVKRPRPDVFVKGGDPVYIDIHSQDTKTKFWSDWNSMVLFHPKEKDYEQLEFLEEVRDIQRKGIKKLTSHMTAAEVSKIFVDAFETREIKLLDVRNTVGHSLLSGPKLPDKRIFLEKDETRVLGEGIFAIEPGGYRKKKSGEGFVVARFEDAIYLPQIGPAKLLGKAEPIALTA